MGCGRCFKCREGRGCIRDVSFSAAATPTRRATAVAGVAKDRRWDADMPAYKRLRKNGVQPRQIDGSAALETRASDQFEVELGTIVPKEAKSRVQEGLAISREIDWKPQKSA